MTATQTSDRNINSSKSSAGSPYQAFDLGWSKWTLGFTTGFGGKVHQRTIEARDLIALGREIEKARKHFKLPENAPVFSCYEAGRDGFWLHRCLLDQGVQNIVVDSASIEVNRRAKRAKTDRLDVQKLLSMLVRYHHGEEKVWSVVNPPSVEDEEGRELHRELRTLKQDRTRHGNRIKGLLAGCGHSVEVDKDLPQTLRKLKTWDGKSFVKTYSTLHGRILREFKRMELLEGHIRQLERERSHEIRHAKGERIEKVRQLLSLRGIGQNGAWLYVMECFGWRNIRNRRQLGSLVGLTPPPYQSGETTRDQGMSKAGNRWMRGIAIELGWCWLRFQPGSELSRWYQRRFGGGSKRVRKIGIVALARKLLIKLWQYLETGALPEGALVVDWRQKLSGHSRPVAEG